MLSGQVLLLLLHLHRWEGVDGLKVGRVYRALDLLLCCIVGLVGGLLVLLVELGWRLGFLGYHRRLACTTDHSITMHRVSVVMVLRWLRGHVPNCVTLEPEGLQMHRELAPT